MSEVERTNAKNNLNNAKRHTLHSLLIDMAGQAGVKNLAAVDAEAIADLVSRAFRRLENPEMGTVSDGYHTFDELYAHRVRLFSTLMRAHPDKSWWSFKHHDGSAWEGWIIAGIDTPAGTATYHLPASEIDFFSEDIAQLENGKEWDGHTAEDVLERLKSL